MSIHLYYFEFWNYICWILTKNIQFTAWPGYTRHRKIIQVGTFLFDLLLPPSSRRQAEIQDPKVRVQSVLHRLRWSPFKTIHWSLPLWSPCAAAATPPKISYAMRTLPPWTTISSASFIQRINPQIGVVFVPWINLFASMIQTQSGSVAGDPKWQTGSLIMVPGSHQILWFLFLFLVHILVYCD